MMKKLLGIVVLGLLISGKSNADTCSKIFDYEENKIMFSSLYLKGEESYHSNDNIYYNPFTVFSKAILPTDKEMFGETKEAENV